MGTLPGERSIYLTFCTFVFPAEHWDVVYIQSKASYSLLLLCLSGSTKFLCLNSPDDILNPGLSHDLVIGHTCELIPIIAQDLSQSLFKVGVLVYITLYLLLLFIRHQGIILDELILFLQQGEHLILIHIFHHNEPLIQLLAFTSCLKSSSTSFFSVWASVSHPL